MISRKGVLSLLATAAIGIAAANGQSGKTARGRYLTEEVAKCQECHTPRLASGELDRSRWLKGAAAGTETAFGKLGVDAPDITSASALWQRWSESGFLHFLETAKDSEGRSPAPPMPGYQLRRDDAEAIVSYLKSLK